MKTHLPNAPPTKLLQRMQQALAKIFFFHPGKNGEDFAPSTLTLFAMLQLYNTGSEKNQSKPHLHFKEIFSLVTRHENDMTTAGKNAFFYIQKHRKAKTGKICTQD